MSIMPTYSQMRQQFATSTTRAADGYYVWPAALVNSVSGFINTIAATRVDSTPDYFLITVDASADANFNNVRYDWFLSQRTETVADQMFTTSRHYVDSGAVRTYYSGILRLDVSSSNLARLAPDASVNSLSDPRDLAPILKNVYAYARRRSDGAIQVCDLTADILSDY